MCRVSEKVKRCGFNLFERILNNEPSAPSVDDYLIDADYPIETFH
jgi:hypothetical protein